MGVALRLGLSLCVAHDCHCGSRVDEWGTHAMVCKRAPGRISRHHAVNEIIARSFTSAGIPVAKEPAGLLRSDGRRPDGLTLVPWRGGKPLAWDATISSTLAESYLDASSVGAASAAEGAAARKVAKYTGLPAEYSFQPVALETLGPVSSATAEFIDELGQRISERSGEPREAGFLWQRLSVCIQRFNAILLFQSFVCLAEAEPDE